MVWVFEPETETVTVHTPDGQYTLDIDGTLRRWRCPTRFHAASDKDFQQVKCPVHSGDTPILINLSSG